MELCKWAAVSTGELSGEGEDSALSYSGAIGVCTVRDLTFSCH